MVPAADLDAPATRPRHVAPFAALAAALAFFHHLGAFFGPDAEKLVDLATPFAVLGSAFWLLATLGASARVLWLAGAGALLYTDGHGMHLAANAIGNSGVTTDEVHFWDETWGHIEWHVGLVVVFAAVALAGRAARLPVWPAATGAAAIGFTLFTNTVEGGDWWLALLAAALFVPWGLGRRPTVLAALAAAFALCAALIGVWAAWQGGVPQFSELGWL